jgi:membrane-associated protease RseP (regulator of RpoE activity)
VSLPRPEPHYGDEILLAEPTRRHPRRRPWLPALLGLLTIFMTLVTGAVLAEGEAAYVALLTFEPLLWFEVLRRGLPYALCLMGFFFVHEMGHFLACRYYRVDCTFPFFIPGPPAPFFGTFGAVIRIRSPIPHRRALFDIGVAGPLAGFVVAAGVLAVGVWRSTPMPPTPLPQGVLVYGESLLTHGLRWIVRPDAVGQELLVDPIFIAGWIGMLATVMNLFPAGQLDGGHIAYALTPRWHRAISISAGLFLVGLIAARFAVAWEVSAWTLWAVIILVLGRRHPPLPQPGRPLGRGRVVLAVLAAVIFLLCFTPRPIGIT